MKKIGAIVAVCILLVGSGTLAGIQSMPKQEGKNGSTIATNLLTVTCSEPKLKIKDEYSLIQHDEHGTMRTMRVAGYPQLPYQTHIYQFPLGTKIHQVTALPKNERVVHLDKKIAPAPAPVTADMHPADVIVKEGAIYASTEPYPADWISWRTGVGLYNDERVVFLKIQAYPYRYIPAEDNILYADTLELEICTEGPGETSASSDTYDLLIVTTAEFTDHLDPLVSHKENHGMDTLMVDLDEIARGDYFAPEGRDGAEQIKYFIKNAMEEWGIRYVLLVGGKKSYWMGNWGLDGPGLPPNDGLWHVPVRYSNLGTNSEAGYLSDLYFADIYQYDNGNVVFEDWDGNGNGVFGQWRDHPDLYPDVYVGRLACRSTEEVDIMVDKIISYEQGPADPSWFNRVCMFGGDTFPLQGDPFYEGEIETSHGYSFLPDQFTAVTSYASTGTMTKNGGTNMLISRFAWIQTVQTISEGCGFLYVAGHGSPESFVTHHPHNEEYYIYGLNTYNMDPISNGHRLPICVVGGCHNSEFNVSFSEFTKNVWNYVPTFECWSWKLASLRGGGSIATIGCTGLGIGAIGDYNDDGIPDCIQAVAGWLEPQFFHAYGVQGKDVLGDAHSTAIIDYINTFPCDSDRSDAKSVQEWVLLGDPSLKIGGYT